MAWASAFTLLLEYGASISTACTHNHNMKGRRNCHSLLGVVQHFLEPVLPQQAAKLTVMLSVPTRLPLEMAASDTPLPTKRGHTDGTGSSHGQERPPNKRQRQKYTSYPGNASEVINLKSKFAWKNTVESRGVRGVEGCRERSLVYRLPFQS